MKIIAASAALQVKKAEWSVRYWCRYFSTVESIITILTLNKTTIMELKTCN